jgi:hypothetical protein
MDVIIATIRSLAAWSKRAPGVVRPGESPSAGGGGRGGAQKRKGRRRSGEFGRARKRYRLLDEDRSGGRYLQIGRRESKKPHGGRSPLRSKNWTYHLSYNATHRRHFRENAAQHTARMGTPTARKGRKRDTLSRNGSNRGHRNPICRHSRNGVLFGVGPAPRGGVCPASRHAENNPLRSMEGAYHRKLVDGRYVLPTYAHACRS